MPRSVSRKPAAYVAVLLVLAGLPFAAPTALGQTGPNYVAGSLFTLTDTPTAPNGVWSWFEDERAIVDASDPANPRLLVSSVSAGSGAEAGDIDLVWRNLTTGVQGHFELADRLEQDDHNSAALTLLPDGRYLAMYSRHGTDRITRWRISANPHDPAAWGPEQTLTNPAGTTYNNTYFLPGDNGGAGRFYNFTRTVNYDPNVQVSADGGQTWQNAGKLLTEGGGGDRPYLRYAASDEAIYFIATDRHPRNFPNSVYSGYVRDGKLHALDGRVVDDNLFDATAVAPSALTPVFSNGMPFGGTTMNRAWTISLETDNTGNPVGVFSARANDNNLDHRFFYSRFDGAEWQVHEMARAGGYLYAAEDDYTGLVSIDPDNPNVVYMSSPINPTTQAATPKYELYKGVTANFGESWKWTPLTAGSTMDNLRPVVPQWNGDQTAVVWLRGTYTTYTNWSTEVVGLSLAATDPRSLLWRGDSPTPSVWGTGSAGNWDAGGGAVAAFRTGDEVAFDDTAATTSLAIQGSVSPMGVAFANRQRDYLVAGGGIAGTGGLRVIGGGRVTLANAANQYTGETLVARGTLALAAGSSLAGTSRIAVQDGAVFDVSGSQAGGQLQAGQSLDLAGTLRGSLNAGAGSSVNLAPTSIIVGSLSAAGAALIADGTIEGNVVASGTTLRVGSAGIEVIREAVYVDATHGAGGNTRLATGGVFQPTTNPDWQIRSPFGNGGVVYQGGSDSPGTAATLQTTVGGLEPGGSYRVYVNFWDASGSRWRILAGTRPDQLRLFDSPLISVPGAIDGIDPATLGYRTPPLLTESNRTLWAGDLGDVVADAQGRIAVYVDDTGTVDGDDRTWYDGITYLAGAAGFTGQATLAVGGDLTLSGSSRLALDIATPAAHDRITIGGRATFAGSLEVAAADAGLLRLGDRFDLFDFAAASGSFSELRLPGLPTGLEWDSSELNRSGAIAVVPAGFQPTLALEVASGAETQAWLGHPSITRAAAVTKTGAGTLIFDAANAYTGPTTVAEGTLRVTNVDALTNSSVTINSSGMLAVGNGVVMRAAAVTLAGGRVDVGVGGLAIAAGGITAADLRAALVAGRNGGGWDGSSGINSAAAAVSGSGREVGYALAADGSAIVAFAAAGDADMNGEVNVFDLVAINGSAAYGSGAASVWSTGDFNYDGVTNVFDLVATSGTNTFGQGTYRPASALVGGAAAVPEPGFSAAFLAAAAALWAAFDRAAFTVTVKRLSRAE
jgi:autotransporter-associated beta strand protein